MQGASPPSFITPTGAPTPDHGGLLAQQRHYSFCSAIDHLACSWLAISKDQWKCWKETMIFNVQVFVYALEFFFKSMGLLDLVA
jgi:hypothetical protein